MKDEAVDVYQRLTEALKKPSRYMGGDLIDFRMFPSANKDRSAFDIATDALAMHEEVLAGRCNVILEIKRAT